ncbi:MAG: hypothetical protein J2P17_09620 [Mycobacterium sp.]|nr:hypothetical protein [Mycobacterium sp.]
MRLKALSLLPALALAAGLVTLPASSVGAAATPITKSLPITTFDQVIADSAHGHLFFSEGDRTNWAVNSGGNAILVTDLSGNTVATVNGLTGVRGLALSPDGSTLYAAVTGANVVVAISTSTLKVTATYPVQGAPYSLAFQDGILWVGYAITQGDCNVGYIDLTAADPAFAPGTLPTLTNPPFIAGDPSSTSAGSTTGTLVATETGVSPAQLYSFKLSGTTVTSSASVSGGGNPLHGLNVLPGGSQFVLDGSLYDTATLSIEGSYPAVAGSSNSAVAPNGMVAVGGTTYSSTEKAGISTFPSGSTEPDPAEGYTKLGNSAASYVAGLDWSADSSELFAVITQDDSSNNVTGYSLQTLYPPAPWHVPYPLTLSTTASTLPYEGKVGITVSAAITDDSTAQTVNIYETPIGGQKKLLKTVSLGSGIGFSFTTGELTSGASFTASTAGDSEFGATTTPAATVNVYASTQENISGYYGSQQLSALYRLYHKTSTLRVNTTVFPNKAGQCVKFEFQHNNGTAWVPLTTTGCATLDSASKFVITRALSGYATGSKTRIRVDYYRSSTDTRNLNSSSGWMYYLVEK